MGQTQGQHRMGLGLTLGQWLVTLGQAQGQIR
jgi:hypothetical protein